MTEAFLTDEDREESVIERRERERFDVTKVENTEEIPLFPNVKQDQRKIIASLLVFKMDPPGDGFKGRIAPTSDHETIARLYGNGVYDLHAAAPDGKVLRRNSIKVAWQPPTEETPATHANGGDLGQVPKLLDWQASQHAKDAARTEAFARMSIEGAQANAKQHIETLATSQAASTERDRAYFASLQAQQQSFFQNMMTQTQQAHMMAMERSREEFRQTLQLMQISHERAVKATDPTLLFSLFREGIALGAGSTKDDDEGDQSEPWAAAIQAGASAIKDITEVAKLKAIGAPKLPPALPVTTPPTPAATPANTPTNGKPKSTKPPPFDPSEVAELLRLKAILSQKGMDFGETVRNASSWFVAGGDIGGQTTEQSGGASTGENAGEPAQDAGAPDME